MVDCTDMNPQVDCFAYSLPLGSTQPAFEAAMREA